MKVGLPRFGVDALLALQQANLETAAAASKLLACYRLSQVARRPSSGIVADAVIKESRAKATTATALRFGVTIGPCAATSLTEVVKQWFPEGANLDEGLATCT